MQHAEKERRPLLPLDAARANRRPLAYDDLAGAVVHGHAARRAGARGAARVHRLAVLLPRLGAEGEVPGDPRAAGGAGGSTTTRSSCSTRSSATVSCRARRLRLLARARRGRRHRPRERRALPDAAPAVGLGRLAPEPLLADYVAPADDHLGAFAVGIHGADELAARYEAEHDDYRAIMVKALADRLAEAFAEWLHLQARREWYEPDAAPTSEELIAESYRGIRPAFGYPACPDHSEKRRLFDLLDAEAAGIALTESFAMTPAAAVSGLYFGASRREVLRRRPASGATRSRTTRRARGSRSRRPSAGSARTSGMTRTGVDVPASAFYARRMRRLLLVPGRSLHRRPGDRPRGGHRPEEAVHGGRPGQGALGAPQAHRLRRLAEASRRDTGLDATCPGFNPTESDRPR